ncbi:MAG: molybdopterin-dependent oxidoreductase, partial [Methanobacteriaceae archaeon]|nr:molybdopterin-dependent oxidoreductase [Methanobacteriaceae archaeon]
MYKPALISVLLVAGLLIFFSADYFLNPEVDTLDAVQVKNYQGQKLSSINDFRENSIKGPQNINISNYTLQITGKVEKPQNFTYNSIIKNYKNYQKVVTLDCVERWSATILCRGYLVSDLINEAKTLEDGKVVIFYAVDGYSTSFPIEYLIDNKILIAYQM